MKILSANIVTAFEPMAIGSKVTNKELFLQVLEQAIQKFDFSSCTVPGQGLVPCDGAIPFVSSGVGRRTSNPDDYVLRLHRGRVSSYLRRDMAEPVTGCSCVVYTREAFLKDPDVINDPEEIKRVSESDATHILVAVLAFTGPATPLLPFRLVSNLAGGNREALVWDGDTIRTKARESLAYDEVWCTVADDHRTIHIFSSFGRTPSIVK